MYNDYGRKTNLSGNLTWRQNNKYSNLKEDFTYDNLDRLDNVKMGSIVTLDIMMGIKERLQQKPMWEPCNATSGKPYAISTINPATALTPGNTQTLTYTSFDKISTISENNYNATFTYGIDNERAKMVVLNGSTHVKTRWYPGGSVMKVITIICLILIFLLELHGKEILEQLWLHLLIII